MRGKSWGTEDKRGKGQDGRGKERSKGGGREREGMRKVRRGE